MNIKSVFYFCLDQNKSFHNHLNLSVHLTIDLKKKLHSSSFVSSNKYEFIQKFLRSPKNFWINLHY